MNGESVICKSYAQVVQMIQKSGPILHMVVMPKEHDVLQQVPVSNDANVLHLFMNSSQLTLVVFVLCRVVFC